MNAKLSLKFDLIDENIVVLALIFSPFTQLRIGFIGLTELLVFLLFTRVLVLQSKNRVNLSSREDFIFTRFWAGFIFISTLGTAYNYIILNHISGTFNTLTFDFSAYIIVFLVCFSLETLIYNSKDFNVWQVIKKTYVYSSSLFLFLYLISYYFGNIFGLPLLHYNFFRPFANNIHHISMSIAPLPFVGLKLYTLQSKRLNKLKYIILIISNIMIANATGSLKVILGLVVGLIVFFLITLYNKIRNHQSRVLLLIFTTLTLIITVSIYFEPISIIFLEFFMEEDMGGGRQILWSNSIVKIMNSPILGYGPGAHANYYLDSFSDAHQTFLTLGLQAGLIGIVFYSILNYKILMKIYIDPYITSAFIGILMYALGGDILRRIPMWIFMILFYYFVKNSFNRGEDTWINH